MKKQDFFTRPGIVCITAVFCCALWGSAVPFIKTGYRLFSIDATDTASILVFAGLRFALAGILVLIAGSFFTETNSFADKDKLKGYSGFSFVSNSRTIFFVLYRFSAYQRG